MPAWTDCTMVRMNMKEGSGALSDVEINRMCDWAEGKLKASYKITSSFSFNANKYAHLILRLAATADATKMAHLATLTLSTRTLDEVSLALDGWDEQHKTCLGILNSKSDVVGFLEEEAD